jgi:hypothetical protein
MKKQNRLHTFALSMLMTGLSVMPVGAFSGQIDSGVLETVTCINHDTGEAAPGTVSATGFDCQALPSQPGEVIGVVLSGTTDGNGPPPPDGCQPSQTEMEPNNEMNQAQELGMVQGDCRISVTGQTTVGYGSDANNPAPNTDVDWYVVDMSQASQPMVAFLNFEGGLSFYAKDFDTGQDLDMQSTDAGWMISGQPSRVAIGVLTDVAKAYTLQFSDGASNLGDPSVSQSSASDNRIQRLQQR